MRVGLEDRVMVRGGRTAGRVIAVGPISVTVQWDDGMCSALTPDILVPFDIDLAEAIKVADAMMHRGVA